MNKFYTELLDTLDQTGAAPDVQLAVLNLIEKQGAQQDQEATQGQNLITADEWKGLKYKDRLALYETNRAAYDAATLGNFKEDKR